MTYENIGLDKQGGIALITLNRPQRLNTFTHDMFREINAALDDIMADEDARVIIFTGAPRPDGRPHFSAGVDARARAEGQSMPPGYGAGTITRIDELLKPTIAAVDGICTTGATELALACDIRVLAETAQVSDWHLKNLGLGTGGWGAAERMLRLVGAAATKDLILTGRVWSGQEAYRVGFATYLTTSENLLEEARRVAGQILDKAPRGVAVTLSYIDQAEEMQKHQALRWAELVRELGGVQTSLDALGRRLTEKSEGGSPS